MCGASAAMALAAVLPRNENSERNLVFTVISVTLLSTVAMVVYPMLMTLLGFDARAAGLFLGGTIHDVAQVVGAGYTMSEETGDVSTVVKLMRVSLLAPVVFLIALAARRSGATRQKAALLPGFVLAFLGFAMINSVAPMPEGLTRTIGDASGWLLLTAVSAVGMKTSLKQVQDVGGQAFALVICETLILAGFFLGGLWFLGTS
ncbi:MAG: putative sulfate exporter family transporter [Marinovum algicola]